jgi:hypothetical protein
MILLCMQGPVGKMESEVCDDKGKHVYNIGFWQPE